jgi:uncharacterized protein (UPF0548 family)
MRFRLEQPSSAIVQRYVERAELQQRPFNHGFLPQGTRPETGLRVITCSSALGEGKQCFRAACGLLLQWKMHGGSEHSGITWLGSDGDTLVTWARMAPGCWVLNPCRSVPPSSSPSKDGSTTKSCSVAYATLEGHLIAGVEHMTVSLDADERVWFHVHSASRGAGLLGRLIFPLLGPSQHRFFNEQCRCMQEQLSNRPRKSS